MDVANTVLRIIFYEGGEIVTEKQKSQYMRELPELIREWIAKEGIGEKIIVPTVMSVQKKPVNVYGKEMFILTDKSYLPITAKIDKMSDMEKRKLEGLVSVIKNMFGNEATVDSEEICHMTGHSFFPEIPY